LNEVARTYRVDTGERNGRPASSAISRDLLQLLAVAHPNVGVARKSWQDRVHDTLPPPGIPRRLCLLSMIYALGAGAYLSGNVVFLTRIVGLSAEQVALGLSIAGGVTLLTAVPLGALADRWGAQRVWFFAALVEAMGYLAYPWLHGFVAFLCVLIAIALAEATGNSGRVAYTLNVLPEDSRVRVLAQVRAALNAGFSVGALLGAVALGIGTRQAIIALPVVTGAVLLANTAVIRRLPALGTIAARSKAIFRWSALKDRLFVALALLNGALGSHQALLGVVVPLWLITRTDAPKALLAWLLLMNTIVVIVLQVRASNGADTIEGAARAARRAATAIGLGCCVLLVSHNTHDSITIACLVGGVFLISIGELFQAASGWGLAARLSPPERRAEYQGVWRVGNQLQQMLAPAAFTYLTVTWLPVGWLVIALLLLAAAVAVGSITRRGSEPHAS
jgi:MFS family permease